MTVSVIQNLLASPSVSQRDKDILAIPEAQTHWQSWTDLQHVIQHNELHRLSRSASQLAEYILWKRDIESKYSGGVMEYILVDKLRWTSSLEKRPVPYSEELFGDVRDVQILLNDFPYAMEKGLVHVVVWSRAKIPKEGENGDITAESRAKLEAFVNDKFVKGLDMSSENVLWFKNWAALQSIPLVEHFHVLLKNPDMEKLKKLCS
ncbi:N-acetylglucosamine-induced protein 1 [Yarrowia sp. E02]|nr:N-acetylglucosamine-induced protein 1 [Yarrowia sp. E02]